MKKNRVSHHQNIIIEQLSFLYDNVFLFENLNFTLKSGFTTCLLGPSGVGKTTLLRLIAGLEKSPACTIHLKPTDVAYMAQSDLLLPWLSAIDNALIGYKLRGELSEKLRNQAIHLFEKVGIIQALHQYPIQLSGGMKQRVALVRTLLENKNIILMDEPFSAVDCITRFQLQTLATELLKKRTVLFVTHDPLEALRMADEIYILAGKPAKLTLAATLTSEKPRSLNDEAIMHYQTQLFDILMRAKEMET